MKNEKCYFIKINSIIYVYRENVIKRKFNLMKNKI